MIQTAHQVLDLLRRIFSSRYVLFLEARIRQLEQENKVLLSRCIPQAGPTAPAGIAPAAQPVSVEGANPTPKRRVLGGRLSWQQVNRQKEAEDERTAAKLQEEQEKVMIEMAHREAESRKRPVEVPGVETETKPATLAVFEAEDEVQDAG